MHSSATITPMMPASTASRCHHAGGGPLGLFMRKFLPQSALREVPGECPVKAGAKGVGAAQGVGRVGKVATSRLGVAPLKNQNSENKT